MTTRKRVLVAEDSQISAMIPALLGNLGYDVDLARNAHEALNLIDGQAAYDAILIHLSREHGEGSAILERLTLSNPEVIERTVVVVAQPELAGLSIFDGIRRVICEPATPSALATAIRSSCSRPAAK